MLTATQRQLLTKLRQHGTLQLYKGGYWSQADLNVSANPTPNDFEFYFSSVTVNALIAMRAAVVTDSYTENGQSIPTKISHQEAK